MTNNCRKRVLYKGTPFHSLLEAQWASFFDTVSISYQYRPARFNLSPGLDLWYEPQFFLVDHQKWFEAFPRLGSSELCLISWALAFARHIRSCAPPWPSSTDCYLIALGPVGADSEQDQQSGVYGVADVGLNEPETIVSGGGASLRWAQCRRCGEIWLYDDEDGLLSWPDAVRCECCGLEQTGWSAQRGSAELLLAIRQANSLADRDGSEIAVI